MHQVVAPAKVILFGEHSIVYPGNLAVLSTIDLKTICTTSKASKNNGKVNLRFKYFGKTTNIVIDIAIAKINYSQALKLRNDYLITNDFTKLQGFMSIDWGAYYVLIGKIASTIDLPSLDIKIEINIPIGSGMGSSASITSSIIKSIYLELGINIPNKLLFNLTKEVEDFQHGRSSGADPSVIINGGVISYKHSINGDKIINQIVPKNEWTKNLILINTGKPIESTGEMVSNIRSLYNKNQDIYKNKFAKISNISKRFIENNYDDISQLINSNGKLLEQIGVVSKKVIDFSKKVREQGGAVKIAGAGGYINSCSGILICKLNDVEYLNNLIREYSYKKLPVRFAVEGVI